MLAVMILRRWHGAACGWKTRKQPTVWWVHKQNQNWTGGMCTLENIKHADGLADGWVNKWVPSAPVDRQASNNCKGKTYKQCTESPTTKLETYKQSKLRTRVFNSSVCQPGCNGKLLNQLRLLRYEQESKGTWFTRYEQELKQINWFVDYEL